MYAMLNSMPLVEYLLMVITQLNSTCKQEPGEIMKSNLKIKTYPCLMCMKFTM